MKKIVLYFFIILFSVSLIADKDTFVVETGPQKTFAKEDIKSIAIQQFDTTAIKSSKSDYVALRNKLEYDILQGIFKENKIRVIQGAAIENVNETEVVERSKGDLSVNSSKVIREVHYNYDPYHKVDAILMGYILEYKQKKFHPNDDYVVLSLRLIDKVDGTIFWITRMKGRYIDIVYTIVNTLINKRLITPAGAIVGTSGGF